MLDEKAIARLEEMARPQIHTAGGNEYVINRSGSVTQIRPELDVTLIRDLFSLDALVKMVRTEALKQYDPPVYIMADAHNGAECFLQPCGGLRNIRRVLYTVTAKDVPGWGNEETMPYEEALIAVRTRFQQTEGTEYLLRLLSSISNKAKVTYAENGVATSVVTEKGIALQSSEQIRPIVPLRPYRTFQEIEQPLSEFHIRITERGIKFIEADGGMWKLAARKTIAEYFSEKLETEIEAGQVVVML